MQSAVPQVLQTLDRTHDPKQVKRAVQWAKAAGMQVSVDLIYGTPGETLSDWKTSVQTALDLEVNHISAYALSLEPHTKMGRAVARGLLPAPDDDDAASKYELADEMFAAGGLSWYEISNWARGGPTGPNVCRHNLAYWRGNDWVGLGPGAHSHLSGTRWWNVLHPRQYAALLQQGELPIAEKEQLTPKQAALEKVMLGLRLAEGLPISAVESGVLRDAAPSSSSQIGELIAAGLICGTTAESERRIRLTRSGRLLADLVTQKLT
jgi:oxygen-independent coproporphyrinogen-3 oxidase